MNSAQVTCFGEILWDVFPTHKVIGGAPLNVALRLQSFGVNVIMISSIGDDDNGKNVMKYLDKNKMITTFVQIDAYHDTGHVIVTLDEKGSASYEIFNPVAWDHIQVNQDNLELVSNSEVFVFGSLACRKITSKETLFRLIEKAKYKVFDVNLRAPDYTLDLIFGLMEKANLIKMNDEELDEICAFLNCNATTIEERIKYIAKESDTDTICVTKGGDGAILYKDGFLYYNNGFKVTVEDTVGAGDSFLASLISKLVLDKKNPQESVDFACAVGSLVASKKGANAIITSVEIEEMMSS